MTRTILLALFLLSSCHKGHDMDGLLEMSKSAQDGSETCFTINSPESIQGHYCMHEVRSQPDQSIPLSTWK